MEKINSDKNTLKKFAITMGTAFIVISVFLLIKYKHSTPATFIISLVFYLLAFLAPSWLRPIYIFWMKFAYLLNWINTRLILCILFYLIFTPIGLGMRLFKVDLLDRRIKKGKNSYWREKEKGQIFNPIDYQRQF